MFTGLVETTGVIQNVTKGNKSYRLFVEPRNKSFTAALGDSISISGVCLTVEEIRGPVLVFRAVHETLQRSIFSGVRAGLEVNLERSLMVGGRLDGHFVLGHVDGVGVITNDRFEGDSLIRTIEVPQNLVPFMAEKGSVAIDGISLTIARSEGKNIAISIIPYSLQHTTMEKKKKGDSVNVECDVLARYIFQLQNSTPARQTENQAGNDSLYNKLERLGF